MACVARLVSFLAVRFGSTVRCERIVGSAGLMIEAMGKRRIELCSPLPHSMLLSSKRYEITPFLLSGSS